MGVPTRSVLVIGHRDSNALELLGTLTAKRKGLTFPCLHRVKIESDDGILHAELKLWMRADPHAATPGEPEKHDAIVIVYDAFKAETTEILKGDWKEKIASFESPKILVATNLEQGVEHFITEERSDSNAENPNIFSAASAETLSADLGVAAFFEVSNRYSQRVRDVFSYVLRTTIDPSAKKDISEDEIRETRGKILSYLRDKGVGVPIEKPKRVKSAQETQQAKQVLQALGSEQLWKPMKSKNGRTFWRNSKTGEKVKKKKEFPPGFDGETTQEEREKIAKKKIEHEIDKIRTAHINEANDERLKKLSEIEYANLLEFESVINQLVQRRDALQETVDELQKEYKEIRDIEATNNIRGEQIQDLADLRVRKDAIIQQRVEEDVEHERKMAELQEQLNTLKNTDRPQPLTAESFEKVATENRRYQLTLKGILEESRSVRDDIKKVEQKSRDLLAKTDTEEMGCITGETKIQKLRNDHTKLREAISGLRREKDWLTNELIMQKGTEAAHATQLREWKREKKHLLGMISEINDRITQQEVPIAEYLEEEKRKARLRGGPLLLDEEDEAHWRNRKPKAGDYRAPSDKQLMMRLKNEHDRLLLEYQFLCGDLAEKAAKSDTAFGILQNTIDDYIENEQKKSEACQDVSSNLHKLLLLLQDLMTTRTRALRRLESKETKVGDQLLALEDVLQGLMEQSRAGVRTKELEDKTARTRRLLYKKTAEMERISLLRKEQCKAMKAISEQKENVSRRIRDSGAAAEQEEEDAALLVADCRELVAAVEKPHGHRRGKQCRTFLSKAMTGLHTDTQAMLVKKCSGSTRVPLAPKGNLASRGSNLPCDANDRSTRATTTVTTTVGSKATQGQRPSTLACAEAQYNSLVASLKKEFGVAQGAGGGRREGWKNTW